MNEISPGSLKAARRADARQGIHLAKDAGDLARILDPDVAMVLWRRAVPGHVQGWIDGLSPSQLPHTRAIVPVSRIPEATAAALDRAAMPEGPGRSFLTGDIADPVAEE